MENKSWWKSLTIVPLVIVLILIGLTFWMITSIPSLGYDFTTEELCDWAYSTSRLQRIYAVYLLIVSCVLVSIYGRLRAKKGIGKNEKE